MESHIYNQDFPLENVSKFEYLGYSISNCSNKTDSDVQFGLSAAEGKFQEMRNVLCDREIPIKLRLKIFQRSFVRSRMCHSI